MNLEERLNKLEKDTSNLFEAHACALNVLARLLRRCPNIFWEHVGKHEIDIILGKK